MIFIDFNTSIHLQFICFGIKYSTLIKERLTDIRNFTWEKQQFKWLDAVVISLKKLQKQFFKKAPPFRFDINLKIDSTSSSASTFFLKIPEMYLIRPQWRISPTLPYSSVSSSLTVMLPSSYNPVSQSGPLKC